MLPPGHLAAGYITTKLSIIALLPHFPQANEAKFWLMGIAASLLPDLDMFYTFYRSGMPIAKSRDYSHRKYITHAPFFHLGIALLGYLAGRFTGSSNLELLSILYFIGTWTHFIFDSFFYGIMWLWPFTNRIYSVAYRERDLDFSFRSTFDYWKKFLSLYTKYFLFYAEIMLVVIAILVKLKIFFSF